MLKQLRILYVTGMYPAPGSPQNGLIVKAQKESLEKMGVLVDVCHLRPNGRRVLLGRGLELADNKNKYACNLLHIHYGLSATMMGLIPRLPTVATYHGTDLNGYPLYGLKEFPRSLAYNLAAMMTRQLSRYIDGIIVMTEQMKRRLPECSREKTWVLPMGIDLELFRQTPYEQARRKLKWEKGPVVLFCDNNSERVKRQDLAERSVSLAKEDIPNLRMRVLRGVPYENMPALLSAADCLLITSDREGSPNIVKEALACNLPVVSVDVGDIKRILASNRAAGRVVSRDPVLLAEAVVEVISNPRPDNLRELAAKFGLRETAEKVLNVYAAVLEKHGLRNLN